jgi:putative peptidoglycan lipid II flippase
VLITAYFGLSFRLDAFFVATSFLAIFIITFGDVFDSAGIPSLVKTREREGQESFRGLTGSIFSLALLMGGGLTLLMVLCLPLAPLIVPGFPGQSTGYIHENLLFLLPYALVFLPYHAIGSFFRSIRAFHVYYLVEFLVNLTALVAVFAFGNSIRIVPLSLSLGYLVGFAVFLAWGRGRFRFRGNLRGGEIDNVRSTIRKMLPVYILIYGLIIVDRYFASFLEEGAISALFYGYILATAVPLIMNVENVFVTPLSEESDRSALLTRILSGMWMVALPVMAFTLYFSSDLVRGFFERGAFSARSSGMTTEALRYFILGLPAFFMLPVTMRILQIFNRLRWIPILVFGLLSLDAFLNYLFVFRLGMGIKGIALATSIGIWWIGATEIFLVSRIGVRARYGEMAGVFPGIFLGIAIALGIVALLPIPGSPLLSVLTKGVLFVVVYAVVMFLFPGTEIRRVRLMILESFPAFKQKLERIL